MLDKLRKIEALYAEATTESEHDAARAAAERIRARLAEQFILVSCSSGTAEVLVVRAAAPSSA